MLVVVIDDNAGNAALLSVLVEDMEGCRAVAFSSAQEALEYCRVESCDLVLTDYSMPGMNGIEFLLQFRKLHGNATTPVVVLTGLRDDDVCHAALQAGATDFLTKPVNRTEFMARVRNMLALREHELELQSRAEWLGEEIRKATGDLRDREKEIIDRLCRAAEHRDSDTGLHVSRVAKYARLIAESLGLSDHDADAIFRAAPMHDLGKVSVPDRILLKEGTLTEDEQAAMRTHTWAGYEILSGSTIPLLQMSAEIALCHHEHYDGNGYPRGLAGEQIPLPARIVAVADVFDALLSDRPYRVGWEIGSAVDHLLRGSGTQFDPRCVQAFLSVLPAIRASLEAAPRDDDALSASAGSLPRPTTSL